MAHLLLDNVDRELPLIYVDCGEFDEWPDTPRVRDQFVLKTQCNLIEISGPSILEYYRRAGSAYTQDAEETVEQRRIQRQYAASLEKLIVDYARSKEMTGGYIGMRREESRNRSRLFAMRGPIYYSQGREMWTCCPLANWSGKDIWAYIITHDLAYNELYDLHPLGRERARNGAMIGTRSEKHGRLTFLRQMYPDWWSRFVFEFPDIARRS